MNIAVCCDQGRAATTAVQNLTIANNATWTDAFQFSSPDDPTWTLTGQTFELDVKLNSYDVVPRLSLSTADGRIVVDDPVLRVIHFLVDPVIIQASLTPGCYVYDLVMIDGSDVRVPLMCGTLEVKQGVTAPS